MSASAVVDASASTVVGLGVVWTSAVKSNKTELNSSFCQKTVKLFLFGLIFITIVDIIIRTYGGTDIAITFFCFNWLLTNSGSTLDFNILLF